MAPHCVDMGGGGGGGGLGLMVAETLLEVHPSVCPSLRHHCLPSILLSSVPPSLRLFSASSSSPSRHFCFSSTGRASASGVSRGFAFSQFVHRGAKALTVHFWPVGFASFFFLLQKTKQNARQLAGINDAALLAFQ